jgi:hypothetical protein
MDRDEILHRVTDALCGELDGKGEAQMQATLAADPALAAEARRLEKVWQRLGKVLDEEEQQEQAVLTRVFDRIVEQHHAELSDEELEQAAGGISSMPDGEQIKK